MCLICLLVLVERGLVGGHFDIEYAWFNNAEARPACDYIFPCLRMAFAYEAVTEMERTFLAPVTEEQMNELKAEYQQLCPEPPEDLYCVDTHGERYVNDALGLILGPNAQHDKFPIVLIMKYRKVWHRHCLRPAGMGCVHEWIVGWFWSLLQIYMFWGYNTGRARSCNSEPFNPEPLNPNNVLYSRYNA